MSVLVPAYNEQETIGHVLQRLLALDLQILEVIVVDDGSTDATAEQVRRAAGDDLRVILVQLTQNGGKTAAIAHAIQLATSDILVIQDADLEYDPSDLPALIAPIQSESADVVYGSRFLHSGVNGTLTSYHYLANRALTCLSNLLTWRRLTDIETCYKAFRAAVIKPLELTSHGFGLEVEITAMICQTNARTVEIPIAYRGRSYAEGKKILLQDGISAIGYIFYYNLIARWHASRRQYVANVNRELQIQRSRVGNIP
ncbi:MAG: glycosyltransferase family 2 protein [Planctomycetota bacterium]|nr:glycosyltransferase family 2 protein [Planctomycetota bacterium]